MMKTDNQILRIDVPPAVRRILNRLKESGFEAYIVGGCVRDALLGREPKDWDITTSALPQEVKKLFTNTVDTGIQHGTVMVILGGEGFEVTTYRIDGPYEDSRHPSGVTFTRSLAEDLKRRDFTMNAFAWDENGVVDLFGGLQDMQDQVIRCVGDPDERFQEDALRIMRAVRFSAQLGFAIEERTRSMIQKHASRLKDISRERIRVEWEKTLLSDHPCLINLYRELGMAPYILPSSYGKCFDCSKDALLQALYERKNHEQRGGKEALYAQCGSSVPAGNEPDIAPIEAGEVTCAPIEGGEALLQAAGYDQKDRESMFRLLLLTAFFSNLSPDEANEAFRQLKYDNDTRTSVVKILQCLNLPLAADRVEVKKQLNQAGKDTLTAALIYRETQLQIADRAAASGATAAGAFAVAEAASGAPAAEAFETSAAAPEATDEISAAAEAFSAASDRLNACIRLTADVLNSAEPWCLAQLAVSGRDLIAAGIPAGKKLGEILEKILQKVMQSPTLNTKEQLCSEELLREVEHECSTSI